MAQQWCFLGKGTHVNKKKCPLKIHYDKDKFTILRAMNILPGGNLHQGGKNSHCSTLTETWPMVHSLIYTYNIIYVCLFIFVFNIMYLIYDNIHIYYIFIKIIYIFMLRQTILSI